jgi:protein TonB
LVAFSVSITAHAGIYHQFAQGTTASPQIVSAPLVRLVLAAAPAAQPLPVPTQQSVVPILPPEPVVQAPEAKPQPKPAEPKQPVKPVRTPPRPVEVQPAVAPVPPVPEIIASASPPAAGQPSTRDSPLEPPRASAAYLHNPPPSYPRMLLKRGVEGEVLVRAQVLDDGRCNRVLLQESSGFRLFDEAALAAVKGWHFVPARQGTQTVVAWVDVPITFRINRTQ